MLCAADLAYYGGGCLGARLAGAAPGLRAARAPILAALAANWAAEQWLLDALQRRLEVDARTGEVVASLAEPLWAAATRHWLAGALRSSLARLTGAQVGWPLGM